MHQHVRRFDTNANHAGQQPNHRMRFFLRSLLQPLRTRLLNLLDLVYDKAQSRHISTKLKKGVWRERYPLRRLQRFEPLRCFAQRRLEVPNTEAYQTALHPVDNARAFTDEPLALTVRALGILLHQRRNRCHVAVIWFTTQPADEHAFEQSSVESISFRPAMLARYSHARRVDDVGFDVAGSLYPELRPVLEDSRRTSTSRPDRLRRD